MTSERVYLDKNALSSLWRSREVPERTLLRLRRWLSSPLAVGGPIIVVDPILLEELARFDEGGRTREVDFLKQLPRRLLLRPLHERARYETSLAFGRLDENGSAFSDEEFASVLNDALPDKQLTREASECLARDLNAFVAHEMESRQGMLNHVGGQAGLWRLFSKSTPEDLEKLVVDWARSVMRHMSQVLGLPELEALWPEPTVLPSLFAHSAYMYARMWRLNRDGRKIDGNDFSDGLHYAGAAYADTLVTDDNGFRDIIDLCPGRRPRLMVFAEWVEHELSSTPF